eukprot:CAMPEP_0177262482 /NCGR_PEP_ID=MMETSP0367-20130122/60415_1 /TAXON_ID=447022 ORGANISM="Scrippsiella hangoei-like, Strain SHHI-4" /NCGR_SAMPLE_ID=MMETSP0367 /ASSEMBLY_ACC=CAM_ASM_000362 /LENGTH=77 /DNA_ID=CAMNT_0018717269 /DNA_START=4 /DNA_END=233 /DNA_ORIENTATION=-
MAPAFSTMAAAASVGTAALYASQAFVAPAAPKAQVARSSGFLGQASAGAAPSSALPAAALLATAALGASALAGAGRP